MLKPTINTQLYVTILTLKILRYSDTACSYKLERPYKLSSYII